MKTFNPERELNKIQRGNRNKIIIVVVLLLVVSVISYSFALYQVRYSKRIIYTKVAPFSNKDINIMAVYIDNKPEEEFPKKNTGYKFDHIDCDNKSTAKFDSTKWKVILEAGSKDKCDIYFTKEEGTPNIPELYDGLIPVTYESDGTVLVADTTTEWYNYSNKEWANAVLVSSTNYSKYVNNGEYIINKPIPMSEILQMYVWIPRYKYKLWHVEKSGGTNPQEIKIKFENGTLSTGEATCTIDNIGVETCTNAENGKWYTHPAFTFGDTELTGIWVGKFLPSGSDTNVKIVPNVRPILNANINYMFTSARKIDETYAGGFNLKNEEIDTHMMKSMEWGAMTYLMHSKYGRCEENGSCEEVARNVTLYTTGYASNNYNWTSDNGMKASTTGNMYGIYDTAGYTWEYVMGNMVDSNGNYNPSSSGLNTISDSKYYDKYEYNENGLNHGNGHLGDATRETLKVFGNGTNGNWYGNYSYFLDKNGPWLTRKGGPSHPASADPFAFTRDIGVAYENNSFRVVITAQDGAE